MNDSVISNILYLQLCDDTAWKNEKQIQSWIKNFSEDKLFSLFVEVYMAYNEDMKSMPELTEKDTQLSGQIKYKEKSKPCSEDTEMDDLQLKTYIAELTHTRHEIRSQIRNIQKKWSMVVKERLDKIVLMLFSFSIKENLSFHQVTMTPRPEIKKINADNTINVSRNFFSTFVEKTPLLFSPFLQIVFSGRLVGMKNQQPCIFDTKEKFLFLHEQKTEKSLVFLEVFPNTSDFEKSVLRQSLLKEVLFLSSLWSYYEKLGKCSATYGVVVFKEKAMLNEEDNMEDIIFTFSNGDESLLALSEIHGAFDFSLEKYREQGLIKSRRMKEQPEWLKILNSFSFSTQKQIYFPVLSPSQCFCDTLEEKAERDIVSFLQTKEIEFASLLLFNKIELSDVFFPF